MDTNNILQTLREKFGGDWVIAIRLHPHVKKYSEELYEFGEYVVDASYYPDIQELLVSSDIAITDYSSCIFDFMLSKKPGFIFATDIKEYNTERGFYYPLESTPFPVASTNDTLAENIRNFDSIFNNISSTVKIKHIPINKIKLNRLKHFKKKQDDILANLEQKINSLPKINIRKNGNLMMWLN